MPTPLLRIFALATCTFAATSSAAADEGTPEVAARYPRSVIARPLTLPQGLGVAGADVVADRDFDTLRGAPIAGYGFTDAVELLLVYSFAAKEFEAKGSIDADAGVKLLRGAAGGKLEVIARARGGYNALTETANPLLIGVHAQYNITDTLAIISGVPGAQQLRISLEDDATMTRPIDLSLPIGVGVQPTPELYFQLDTKLVQLDLDDSATTYIGADTTPVTLTAVYNAIPALDLQAAVSTDLSNSPDEAVSFLLGARYYAGRL